nr:carbonic anhydrase [Sunxiuqinia sp.]
MTRLIEVNGREDILPKYRNTPIGLLLEYQNLNKTFSAYEKPRMLIGMCMDNRKNLWVPDNFAYIIRSGGANLFYHEFQVSYAIGVGGVQHIALIGHTNCEMVQLEERKDKFINGLALNAGWEKDTAQMHFENLSPFFEIGNAVDFLVAEAGRLRRRYPKVTIAPLFYNVVTNNLEQIEVE